MTVHISNASAQGNICINISFLNCITHPPPPIVSKSENSILQLISVAALCLAWSQGVQSRIVLVVIFFIFLKLNVFAFCCYRWPGAQRKDYILPSLTVSGNIF